LLSDISPALWVVSSLDISEIESDAAQCWLFPSC
jgi:hypothetical protein